MAISIYRVTPNDQQNEEIAWLCEDEWLIWPQINALIQWLEEDDSALQPAEYVANVGFCWRHDASSGGPVLGPATMRRMADLGMSLYLSEYPGFGGDGEENGND